VKSADLVVTNCNHLLICGGAIPKRKKILQDVGLLKKVCIASLEGRIVFVGDEKKFREEVQLIDNGISIDGSGLLGLPGFIDSHTHLPFAGTREEEFILRLNGFTYQQLVEKGMGIQTTVKATRKASKEELQAPCLRRLDQMLPPWHNDNRS